MNNNVYLPSVSDVAFTYLICDQNPNTKEIEVYGALYPSSDIETRALELFALSSLTMQHNGTNKFYQMCRDFGFNQDVLHNWMKLNGFNNTELAKDFTKALITNTNELNK